MESGSPSDEETETDTLVAAVGMDAPQDQLLEWIHHQQQQELKVISIVGFDGIGKTLLARQAYDDTIESQYEARALGREEQG